MMNPIRRQRLFLVIFIVVAASLAVGLMTYALRDNINLFYPPSDIAAGEAPPGVRIRAGGWWWTVALSGQVIRCLSVFW